MKTIHLAALIPLVAALCGCVPSIHELYTEKDLVFDSALTGRWGGADEKEGGWEFTRAKDDKSYDLILTDYDGSTGKFVAHLVKLDDKLFLDVFPSDLNKNAPYQIPRIGTHTFMTVTITASELQLAMMNDFWLKQLVSANPDAIKHETADGRVILTADTTLLQDFVTANINAAFSSPMKLARKP